MIDWFQSAARAQRARFFFWDGCLVEGNPFPCWGFHVFPDRSHPRGLVSLRACSGHRPMILWCAQQRWCVFAVPGARRAREFFLEDALLLSIPYGHTFGDDSLSWAGRLEWELGDQEVTEPHANTTLLLGE